MSDARQIEADIYERLSKVIDPELGRTPALTTSPCTLS